ncbi:hypothetical protein [Streptomyces griseomycini]|uniref:ABC transporter permease n=1 Tax=Streptomyces griseomycini TaxID=66895 RepID=A0A7W7M375_9ACTN|nr:hypothetical protein [Streptomyces griseomycini]MBB4900461.1 hypothetical protein [Streptomyces griseomycini]GGQ25237.1 hypothetical protein GCM10010266_55670 [Streptomyces griseomycini]GGR38253.1 hypothetical protein GCM10015536_49940 [Streptomyces griseomycini]
MSTTAPVRLPRTVLRLHRTALIVWGAFVAGLTGWLVWLNEVTVDAVRAAQARCSSTSWGCIDVIEFLDYSEPTGYVGALTCYSFLAVAAFTGGSLIGRELESGTARLAWTQGVTPARWLAAKLAVPALVLTAGGTALVLVFRWGWAANRDLMGDNWAFADVFVARGPATVAYALCALAVGALTALLLRRALPALAVSVAAMWLLNAVLERHRARLWPAETRTSPKPFELPYDVWRLEWGRTGTGHRATYHPASHFWPLHLVETGIVLAVAALATAAAFAVLRRRTA